MRQLVKISALLGLAGSTLIAGATTGGCREQRQAKDVFPQQGYQTLQSWGDHALSHYLGLNEEASRLSDVVGELCALGASDAQFEETLSDVQDAYRDARAHWLLNRTFAFGPETDVPLRLGPKIDWQPPRHKDIELVLESEDALEDASLLGAQLRGFSPIEYLLFGNRAEGLAPESRSCEYLSLLAGDLARNAARLYQAWSPEGDNFVAVLNAEGGSSDVFDSSHDALSAIVNRLGYVIENLRDRDLSAPIGEEGLRPELIVSRVSGQSLDDLRDTVFGVRLLSVAGPDAAGLTHFALSLDVEIEDELKKRFREVDEAIEALEPSLEKALVGQPERVAALDDALLNLQLFYQVRVIGALSLSQIFNDADGD